MNIQAPYKTAVRLTLLAGLFFVGLTACTPVQPTVSINDPHEQRNRRTHNFNKSLDKALLKPTSGAYGSVVPDFISNGVNNFASNLSLPGMVLNNLLQLNFPDAMANATRFTVNSTVGLGGILDVATTGDIPEKTTDFGETLYVWGVPEGTYSELPVVGPSTQRATAGMVVDFFIDPLKFVNPTPPAYATTGVMIVDSVGDRDRYSQTIDSILYDSEDSYAQTRLFYLQNRRHLLAGGLTEDDLEDPFAE